jgi:hypothetical protein
VKDPLRRIRRIMASGVVVVGFALSACAITPAPSATPSQAASGSLPAPTEAPATASAAVSSPASSATVTPVGSGSACAVASQSGSLPSDRLVDLAISSTTTHDLLTFVFAASTPGPAGPPHGTIEALSPPFSFAGSGQAIDLLGQHAVQVRFNGMTLAGETGEATYRGPTEAKPGLPALREAIQYDASEGVVGWYIGYDGPGCVTLVREGNNVTVMIAHPEAPAG